MCLPVYEIRVYIVAATKHVWKKLCYTCRAPLVPPTHLGGGERFRFHIVIISLRKIDEKQYTLELHICTKLELSFLYHGWRLEDHVHL